jgi:hypothetical protein
MTELGSLYLTYNPVHDTSMYTDVPARIEAECYNDMYGVSVEGVKDVDGIADVGWIDANDWLEYNINVPNSSEYYFYFRIASTANTSLEVRENNSTLETLQIPNSGGWQNWRTLMMPLTLSPGKHKLRVFTDIGKFNLNWITITNVVNTTPGALPEGNVIIYPSPVTDKLNIHLENMGSKAIVSLINQMGIILLKKEFPRDTEDITIDVSRQGSGFYYVQVKTLTEIYNYRFVKP